MPAFISDEEMEKLEAKEAPRKGFISDEEMLALEEEERSQDAELPKERGFFDITEGGPGPQGEASLTPEELQVATEGVGAIARHAGNTFLANFGDVLGGTAAALGSVAGGDYALDDIQKAYDEGTKETREALAKDTEEHPTASTVGDVAGILLQAYLLRGKGLPAAIARFPKAAALLERASGAMSGIIQRTGVSPMVAAKLVARAGAGIKGVIEGGLWGALYGAGAADADTWKEFGEGARTGATVGSVAGGAAGTLLPTAGRAAEKVSERNLTKRYGVPAGSTPMSSEVAAIVDETGLRPRFPVGESREMFKDLHWDDLGKSTKTLIEEGRVRQDVADFLEGKLTRESGPMSAPSGLLDIAKHPVRYFDPRTQSIPEAAGKLGGALVGAGVAVGAGKLGGIPAAAAVGAPVTAGLAKLGGTIGRASNRVINPAMGLLAEEAAQLSVNPETAPTIAKYATSQILSAEKESASQQSVSQAMEKMKTNPKWAALLDDVSQRGDKAIASSHFVLMQTNPDYRQDFLEAQKD